VSLPGGGVVTNATASIYNTWSGQFVLSHVECVIPTANVKLTKTFEDGPFTHPPVNGAACFTLSPNPGPSASQQCTNTPTWTGLTVGDYTVTETTVPDGYVAIDPIDFTVATDCGAVTDPCVEASITPLTLDLGLHEDALQDGFLSVVKLLGPAPGTQWTGDPVAFNVCANSPADDATEQTPEACASGVDETLSYPSDGESDALAEGYYTVCEVVPDGYIPDDQCQVVKVVAGETADANVVTVINTLATASVSLTKTFEPGVFTEAPAEGDACFTLSPNPGPSASQQCTNTPQWSGLTVGDYTISETEVPDGYLAIADIEFTVAIDCSSSDDPCIEADTADTLTDLGEFQDGLQDGFLSVLKLLGPAPGTAWTGDDVSFNVCANDPADSNVEQTPAACASGADEVLTYPSNAESGALAEGYYTVCEVVPTGYAADDECKVVQVVAGETAEANVVTFINTPNAGTQGCTPGFWQGGNGIKLWNTSPDADWTAAVLAGGSANPPFIQTTLFNSFFTPQAVMNGQTMLDAVSNGGGSADVNKAARSLVAAYLNASIGLDYPYSTAQLISMWDDAIDDGSDAAFLALHNLLDEANNLHNNDICATTSP
jgi:hypothetical protein